jgi:large subunit ribosomal protein L28
MSYQCVICGKKVVTGNNVSHSNRHTRTTWLPNLQNLKIVLNGVTKKAKVCTACIKSGKITRPAKRNKPAKAN